MRRYAVFDTNVLVAALLTQKADAATAAMRQTYREMGEAMLQDERRMASFLADILGGLALSLEK